MSDVKLIISTDNKPASIDFRAGALLLIDKPKDWTSFDVVNKIRYKIRHRLELKKFKVGHAGTLDPMATGLLLVAVGRYTKLIEQLQGLSKTYTTTVKLGATTPSYDAEEEVDAHFPTDHINADLIEAALAEYRGDIMQAPPMFSAVKVNGTRLYKKARKGVFIEIKKRPVTVHELEMTKYSEPNLELVCNVSKGTYIRSLAHDIGRSLNSGGHLTALRRDTVDKFDVKNAMSIEQVVEWIEQVDLIIPEH